MSIRQADTHEHTHTRQEIMDARDTDKPGDDHTLIAERRKQLTGTDTPNGPLETSERHTA